MKNSTPTPKPTTDEQRAALSRAVTERVKNATEAKKAAVEHLRNKHNPNRPR